MKIGFFTGARSEYGIMKNLIKGVAHDKTLTYSLYVSGIHLLERFGYTYREIEDDGLTIHYKIDIYNENNEPGAKEFSKAIEKFSNVLAEDRPDKVFIIGDRPEAYAMALAAHFHKVPICHSGGGNITKGAVDNIYRYNISNLASIHFATSKQNYLRLLQAPIIDREKVVFTGSLAVDSIVEFLKKPESIEFVIPELKGKPFCLMTFHPVTAKTENIPAILEASIQEIINKKTDILLTYPNNDPGYDKILERISRWRNHPNVIIIENLGAEAYYSALFSCMFVIGNSSSGIVEAPYFHKQVINIGTRQEGRETDNSIITIEADKEKVVKGINQGFSRGWVSIPNTNIYGDGKALEKIIDALKNM